MRTSQEHRDALMERLKNATKNVVPEAPAERRDVIPGKRYREERGGIVTVLRSSQYRVVYHREGYSGTCELSRYQFDLRFTEVRS